MFNIMVQFTPVTDNNIYQWSDDLEYTLLSVSSDSDDCIEEVLMEYTGRTVFMEDNDLYSILGCDNVMIMIKPA